MQWQITNYIIGIAIDHFVRGKQSIDRWKTIISHYSNSIMKETIHFLNYYSIFNWLLIFRINNKHNFEQGVKTQFLSALLCKQTSGGKTHVFFLFYFFPTSLNPNNQKIHSFLLIFSSLQLLSILLLSSLIFESKQNCVVVV